MTARGIGQEALSHSALAVPRCISSWETAPTACRDGIAIGKTACKISGVGGGGIVSLKPESVGRGLPLPSVLLCGAEGVGMVPAASGVFESERLLREKVDPTKRLIRALVGLDALGTDVKTSGYNMKKKCHQINRFE